MTKSGGQSVSRSMNRTMTRRGCAVLLAVFAFTPCAVGQEIKTEVVSAFVWGEDCGSDSTLSVRYGGISIDGRAVSLPSVILHGKKLNKRERKNTTNAVEPEKMQCFTSGFLSHDHLFSADGASQTLNVSPKTALTVSSVVRDLRSYPLLCSVEGCHPVGTIRYYLTVNSQDYVFVWPGQSAIYCGN